MNQHTYIYEYPLPFGLPSHSDHHRALVPCAVLYALISYVLKYISHYISISNVIIEQSDVYPNSCHSLRCMKPFGISALLSKILNGETVAGKALTCTYLF